MVPYVFPSSSPAPLPSHFSTAPLGSDALCMAARVYEILERTPQLAGGEFPHICNTCTIIDTKIITKATVHA